MCVGYYDEFDVFEVQFVFVQYVFDFVFGVGDVGVDEDVVFVGFDQVSVDYVEWQDGDLDDFLVSYGCVLE